MTLFPIVERELRVAAKRSRTYWSRFLIGLLGGVGLTGVAVVVQLWLPSTAVPRRVFEFLIYGGFLYSLFGGARLTADCISTEKQEGTLGFLFLTDLRGYDVVLGKLFGKGILPVYTMMAMVPVLWMLSLLGGVGNDELLFGVLKIINTLFLSLAAGVLVSTFILDRRRAEFVATVIILLLFWSASLLADSVAIRISGGTYASANFSFVSLLGINNSSIANVFFQGGITGNTLYWTSFVILHLEAWCLIGIASWYAPRCWQERPSKKSQLPFKERLRQWSFGKPEIRLARRKRFLKINPFFWLSTRNCQRIWVSRILIMLTLIMVPTLLVLFHHLSSVRRNAEPMTLFVLLVAGVFWYLAPKFWISTEATRTLANERRDGSLELLLSTPLGVKEIVSGQWLGLRKYYTAPCLFATLLGAIALVTVIVTYDRRWLENSAYAVTLLACLITMFIMDCITLGWVGMWTGFKRGNVKTGTQLASQRVIFFPSLVLLLIVFPYNAMVSVNWINLPKMNFWSVISLWLFIGLVTDIFLIRLSRRLLYQELRTVAQEPLGSLAAEGAWGRQLARMYMKVFGKGKPSAIRKT